MYGYKATFCDGSMALYAYMGVSRDQKLGCTGTRWFPVTASYVVRVQGNFLSPGDALYAYKGSSRSRKVGVCAYRGVRFHGILWKMRTNWFSRDGKVVWYAYKVFGGRCSLALYAKSSKVAAKSQKLAAEEISGFVPEFRRD